MNIDIDKIDTNEIGNKVNTIKCRRFYEVTEEAYFTESKKFPDGFLQQCKDNSNKAQFISLEIKIT